MLLSMLMSVLFVVSWVMSTSDMEVEVEAEVVVDVLATLEYGSMFSLSVALVALVVRVAILYCETFKEVG